MQKALLILFGGRSMPNMLTIIHEKPELIFAIVSRDEMHKLPQLKDAIAAPFAERDIMPIVDDSYVVNAFDHGDVHEKCLQAVKDHPQCDWIFNITSATTIMSIGAYEAAKELAAQGKPIRCWYLNTLHSQVVPLVGEGRDDGIFSISVDQYVAVYNCRIAQGVLEDQRQYCQDHWLSFAEFLVDQPQRIDLLQEALKPFQNADPSKDGGPKTRSLNKRVDEIYPLLEEAYHVGLLDNLNRNGESVAYALCYQQMK